MAHNVPVVSMPAAQSLMPAAAMPAASAVEKRPKMGRTVMTGVSVGQDSSSLPRKKGFTFDCFYVGEAVSVTRSSGCENVAEVLAVSPTGMIVSLDGGNQKTYRAADVPTSVNKLIGAFYLL
jgi:hypothetical protein